MATTVVESSLVTAKLHGKAGGRNAVDVQDRSLIPSVKEVAPTSNRVAFKLEQNTRVAKPTTYPGVGLDLVDRYIDEPRPLRVAVIGGGLSGVLAGILLPEKVPNIQLTIYEKNTDFVSLEIE